MGFGENLKELRKEKNLSQTALAKLMKVEQATISSWENEIREPDFETLKKLCMIFDVTADYLIGLEK